MTLKCSLLFVLLLLMVGSHAQNDRYFSIRLHEPFKTKQREIPDQYIGSNESGHYLVYSKGKYGQGASSLVKFDSNYLPTGEEIPLTYEVDGQGDIIPDEDQEESLGIIKLNNSLLNISYKIVDHKQFFYSRKIDLNQFKVEDKKLILKLTHNEVSAKRAFTSFVLAQDSSSIGLFYTFPSRSKDKKPKKYGLKVCDTEFNQIASYEFELPYIHRKAAVVDGQMISSNEIIVVTADLSQNKFQENKPPNYNYKVWSFKENKTKIIARISTDGKWINNLKMDIDSSRIRLLGMYAENGAFDARGTVVFTIDRRDSMMVSSQFNPFGQAILTKQFKIDKKGIAATKKLLKFKELPNYVFKKWYTFLDGTSLVIAEQVHFLTQYSTSYGYENILLIYLDMDGSHQWVDIINKNNSNSGTPIYSSFKSISNGEEIMLIYNDNARNLKSSESSFNAFKEEERDQALILAVVTKFGDIKRYPLTNYMKSDNYRIRPSLATRISKNEILLFAQKPTNVKNQRFLSIEILE